MLPKRMNKFRITRSRNGQYSVATLGGNNKTLNSTETLTTLANVRKNLRATILGWQLSFANLQIGDNKEGNHQFGFPGELRPGDYEANVEEFLDLAIKNAKALLK